MLLLNESEIAQEGFLDLGFHRFLILPPIGSEYEMNKRLIALKNPDKPRQHSLP